MRGEAVGSDTQDSRVTVGWVGVAVPGTGAVEEEEGGKGAHI